MIRADMIPDEVVEAAARSMGWTSAIVLPQDRLRFKGHIAAALNAWPGAELDPYPQGTRKKAVVKWYLDLPLPQEPRDE